MSDLIEALWYFTLKQVLFLLGTIFAIITASWLRRLMTHIQMINMNVGANTQNMKKKVEHQLVDIQGHYLKNQNYLFGHHSDAEDERTLQKTR